jgi:hypothetical protein
MLAIYLPLGIVVTVTMIQAYNDYCQIEDSGGRCTRVRKVDVRVLSVKYSDGIC